MRAQSTLLLAPLLASLALAQLDAMNVPAVFPNIGAGLILGKGEPNSISWTNNVTALTSSITSMTLTLGTGTTNQVTEMYPIVTALPWPATSCFTWTPLSDLVASANYTVVFRGLDNLKNVVSLNYCSWFRVAEVGQVGYPVASTCGLGGDSGGVASVVEVPITTAIATPTSCTEENDTTTADAGNQTTTKSNEGNRAGGFVIMLAVVSAVFLF
ncbi:hypothetical protein HDU98_010889 [Podochytrium sp. JEL0797]|nr:hypothetical protein HDU98_010889 [Podochytrium sp. JEL0797]